LCCGKPTSLPRGSWDRLSKKERPQKYSALQRSIQRTVYGRGEGMVGCSQGLPWDHQERAGNVIHY